jgi:predicted alpha/beta-hydrolase family hydrolase
VSSETAIREINDASAEPAVRGFVHEPAKPAGHGLVLTHGAGANCQSKLLVALANAFADIAGFMVLRCDLPFRQKRPQGPPFPGGAENDREGMRRAVEVLSKSISGKVFLGGHSYGGRQATMLAADEQQLVAGLLLLSYPLHPPRKPAELRTNHFPKLRTPLLFVHGARDPFGSLEEMNSALQRIPARHSLVGIAGAGHELFSAKTSAELPQQIVEAFQKFFC